MKGSKATNKGIEIIMEVLRNLYYKGLNGAANAEELQAAAKQKGLRITRKESLIRF